MRDTSQDVLVSGHLMCTCGADWSFSQLPAELLERINEVWRTEHSGPGHEPCDRKTARRARIRAENNVHTDPFVGCDGQPCPTVYRWCPDCDCQTAHTQVSETCLECRRCGELTEV